MADVELVVAIDDAGSLVLVASDELSSRLWEQFGAVVNGIGALRHLTGPGRKPGRCHLESWSIRLDSLTLLAMR